MDRYFFGRVLSKSVFRDIHSLSHFTGVKIKPFHRCYVYLKCYTSSMELFFRNLSLTVDFLVSPFLTCGLKFLCKGRVEVEKYWGTASCYGYNARVTKYITLPRLKKWKYRETKNTKEYTYKRICKP